VAQGNNTLLGVATLCVPRRSFVGLEVRLLRFESRSCGTVRASNPHVRAGEEGGLYYSDQVHPTADVCLILYSCACYN